MDLLEHIIKMFPFENGYKVSVKRHYYPGKFTPDPTLVGIELNPGPHCHQCGKLHPSNHEFCGKECYDTWRDYMKHVVEGTEIIKTEHGTYVFKAPPNPKSGGTFWRRNKYRPQFTSYIEEFEVKNSVFCCKQYPWPSPCYFSFPV